MLFEEPTYKETGTLFFYDFAMRPYFGDPSHFLPNFFAEYAATTAKFCTTCIVLLYRPCFPPARLFFARQSTLPAGPNALFQRSVFSCSLAPCLRLFNSEPVCFLVCMAARARSGLLVARTASNPSERSSMYSVRPQ